MEDHKPYWAVLNGGFMTLYYDPNMVQAPKDSFDMSRVKDVNMKSKDEITFTAWIKSDSREETMTYKFDDSQLAFDWFNMIQSWRSAYHITVDNMVKIPLTVEFEINDIRKGC